MIEMDARFSSFRRATHMAQLIQMQGMVAIPAVVLADPVMTHIVDDGFVLRGIQLHVEGERVWEHEQVWLVTPVIGKARAPSPSLGQSSEPMLELSPVASSSCAVSSSGTAPVSSSTRVVRPPSPR